MATDAPPLGQILVHDQVIDSVGLSDALKHQVVYGGRLGTNLIELGYANHDQVALALAKQHGVPAALTRHLANHDPSLVALVPRDVARRCLAFPIARLRTATDQIAVCFRDPVPDAIRAMAAVLGSTIVPSVASETAVLYWLERCYQLARPQRYAFAAPGGEAPLPRTTTEAMEAQDVDFSDDDVDIDMDIDEPPTLPDEFQLVDLDDQNVVKDTSLYQGKGHTISQLLEVAQESSNLDLAEAAQHAAAIASQAALEAVSVAQAPAPESPAPSEAPRAEPPRPEPLSVEQAVERIASAEDRADVADAALGYMAAHFEGGLMIVVKGDIALGYRGFGGHFDESTVESVVIPLSVPSVFQRVNEGRQPFHGPPPADAHAVQRRFFKLFPGDPPDEVVLFPVILKGRLVCVLYGQPAAGHSIDAEVMRELGSVAAATEQAFLRLLRNAKRRV